MTGYWVFHDSSGSGAWPFLVRGLICLVNSDNERDLNLLISWVEIIFGWFCLLSARMAWRVYLRDFLKGHIFNVLARLTGISEQSDDFQINVGKKKKEASSNNRSVMPLDILGCTRATMKVLTSFRCLRVVMSFATNCYLQAAISKSERTRQALMSFI